jgi:glycosyltransferase involved in cell wall biosynthesis
MTTKKETVKKARPPKTKNESAKQTDNQPALGIVGNTLWILTNEEPTEREQTLTIDGFEKPFPIEWVEDRNAFLTELLMGYNLLENGDFSEDGKKSLKGWEINSVEGTLAGVDLADEWQLTGGHTAFLLASENAPRPSFIVAQKTPVIENVEYHFSGYFATQRADGWITLFYYDENHRVIGEDKIYIANQAEYSGGPSLNNYALVELIFTPITGTKYLQFKIELDEQIDLTSPNGYLFFTNLFLGINNKSEAINDFLIDIDKLNREYLKNKKNLGYISFPIHEGLNEITVIYGQKSTNVNIVKSTQSKNIKCLTDLKHFWKKENYESPLLNEVQQSLMFDEWLVSEMVDLSFFEPQLDIAHYTESIPHFDAQNKNDWAENFPCVKKYLNHQQYDYVFLLPWIKHGGADLAALLHITAASENGDVLVITTEPQLSEWSTKLPNNVDLLPFGKTFEEVPQSFQMKILYALLIAVDAKVIHIINSHVAWKLLENHGGALNKTFKIYVSLYCYDYQPNGEPVGYARNLIYCSNFVHLIFTDNSDFKAHAIVHYGVDSEKVIVLRHPMNGNLLYPQKINFSSKKILWASRIAPQKQPTLLLEIARRLTNFDFYIFGSYVIDDTGWGEQIYSSLKSLSNIHLMGEFDSFDEVLNQDYLFFLYTSKWDGLPNVVLEALSAGLLVIAPAISGIKADLGADRCVLVNNISDASSYISAINWVLSHHDQAESIRHNGFNYVNSNHTWDGFVRQLKDADYFTTIKNTDNF